MAQKNKTAQKVNSIPVSNAKSSFFDAYFIILAIVLLIVAFIRFRLLSLPLERDEGEYAYMGKLILQGIPPYGEAYNMKLPGTHLMYAVLMLFFGKTISGIHLGLLVVNLATSFLLFQAFKKIFNPLAGLLSGSIFATMAISPAFLGFAAHATHFVSLFISLGVYFYARYSEDKRFYQIFLVGIMFGMSFLMKQQAAFIIIMGGLWIILQHVYTKEFKIKTFFVDEMLYSLGVFLPYLLTVLILYLTGVFDKFWFWTIEYASKYASGVDFEQGKMLFNMSFKPMWDEFPIIWIVFFLSIPLLWLSKLTLVQKSMAIAFALFTFLTVCPGFYFRQHYFIPFLPAVGLVVGLGVSTIATYLKDNMKLNAGLAIALIILVLSSSIAWSKNKIYYFKAKPLLLSRMIYGTNPFVESLEVAKYIEQNSAKDDKIAILGSEPQIFLYANRNSGTGYIYTYGLMEIHAYNKQMQQEMIAEIEKSKPKFIVFCNIGTSWLMRPDSPKLIFDWFNKYAQENYVVDGIADITGQNPIYKWGAEAAYYRPQAEHLVVYKRR
ncbi:MAG: ArnT family glycosyltransferase [Cytophagales bacterium]